MIKSRKYGGQWTQKKLNALGKYLEAYLTVLQGQGFSLLYIDAFAGPGFWKEHNDNSTKNLFQDHDEYKQGSPLIALKAKNKNRNRTFEKFYFVDSNEDYINNLKSEVHTHHHEKFDQVKFMTEDANVAVQKLCAEEDWKSSRAVLFLDPFGMKVKWQTIEAIAKTKAIDLWVLFPLGVGVNRMLLKSGNIMPSWRKKLNTLFGNEDWLREFYTSSNHQQQDFLGQRIENNLQKDTSLEKISDYFVRRLKTVFEGVIESPMMLYNSKSNPIFSLCFAVGNKKGSPIAKRIAKHIIENT